LIIGGICIMDESDATEFRPILFQARLAPLVSLTLQVLVNYDFYLRTSPLEHSLEQFSQLERISISLSLIQFEDLDSLIVVEDMPDGIQEQMEAVVRDSCRGRIRQKLFVHFNMEVLAELP
jgi:hypothetical protein